jgi:hypothetical protein
MAFVQERIIVLSARSSHSNQLFIRAEVLILITARAYHGFCTRAYHVCLVCVSPCLQYQVGESCAYENASRTPRDTRKSMEVYVIRGERRQETAQGAFGI